MLDALFAGGAAWFSVPALIGTIIFIVKLIGMLMGGSDDLDVGGSSSATGAADPSGHPGEGGVLLAIVSVQGVSAFMMGFGWAGLGGLQGLHWGLIASMALGLGGGLAMCALFLALLSSTRSLASSGNIDYRRAVGSEGDVYSTIPADGRGQVKLVIGGRQRIVNATAQGAELKTGARIRVVEVKSDNSVVVSAA